MPVFTGNIDVPWKRGLVRAALSCPPASPQQRLLKKKTEVDQN
jgi:hypothetical protein